MAEPETTEEKTSVATFDEAKMAEMIKQGVQSSLQEAIQQANAVKQTSTNIPEEDYFSQLINSKVDGKVNKADLRSQAAEDKIDFYSSDFWTTEIDDLLPGDTPEEIRAAKSEIRTNLEKTFTAMLNSGKGTFRSDLINHTVGEYIAKNKAKVQESYSKRSRLKQEIELEKARRGVDIGAGALSDFQPQDVHKMEWDKVTEKYGQLAF